MTDPIAPPARLGLRLVAGALALVAALALFGTIAVDVTTGSRLTELDAEVANWLHARATPALTRVVLAVTQLNSKFAIAGYSALIALYLAQMRHWRRLAVLVVGVGGVLGLNVLAKLAFQRARPSFDDPLLTLSTYSFPSGHVAGSTVFYGLGVAFVFARTRRAAWRIAAVAGAALAVAAVAFSRIYLGVHYLSDVAAAVAEGIAWLVISLAALDAFWRRRERAR